MKIRPKTKSTFYILLAFCLLIHADVLAATDSAAPTKNKKTPPKTKPAASAPNKVAGAKPARHPLKTAAIPSKASVKTPKTASRPRVAGAKASGTEWVRSLRNWLYPIKVSTAPNGPDLFETRGLAVDNSFLLVPLDSILTAWLARNDLHFYVNNSAEAHVAGLDLEAGVAVLKVDTSFPSSMMRSQIRTDLPTAGETLAAAESRDAIHGGPRFAGVLRDGDVIRYRFQLHGALADGGFIFDRGGNLVSVVSTKAEKNSNDTTWASSTQSILELLHQQDLPRPASLSGPDERHSQLVNWQDRWTRALFADRGVSVSLQNLECRTDLASIAEMSVASKVRQMNVLDCESHTQLPLGGGYMAGLELRTGSVTLQSPSLSETDGLALAKSFGSSYFGRLTATSAQVNLMTVADCQDSSVTNQRGHLVNVRFCTSALKADKGLSDTVVALSGVDAGSHAFVVAAHLKGFDQNNTKKVMEALIENGESLK